MDQSQRQSAEWRLWHRYRFGDKSVMLVLYVVQFADNPRSRGSAYSWMIFKPKRHSRAARC